LALTDRMHEFNAPLKGGALRRFDRYFA
jgi:hypothetical protein